MASSGSTICIDVDEYPKYFRLQVQNNGLPLPPHSPRHLRWLRSGAEQRPGRRPGPVHRPGSDAAQGGDISYEYCPRGSNFIMTLPRA